MKAIELFIGLVGATGSNLQFVKYCIEEILSQFQYDVTTLKFSSFLDEKPFQEIRDLDIDTSCHYKEILTQMEVGTEVRARTKNFSILASYAIAKINWKRPKKINGTAYLFDSLKHPEEAKLLSEIYGAAYYQIGVFSSEKQRISYLTNKKGIDKPKAYELTEKDASEKEEAGQQTRDTFESSDFFIKHNHEDKPTTRKQLERIFDLIFGHPYITPTIDEHMMYMAYSYSTRSADLSRQVGAVVANKFGDIAGVGSNDVPMAGGGPYWPHPENENVDDWRDYKKEGDSNQKNRNDMIIKIMKSLKDNTKNEKFKKELEALNEADLLKEGHRYFKDTGLLDITEFGRATHAEMSAILNCARNGVTPKGKTLYCTTFPCHNCAKHIIEAGIKRVLFVEPYPKSQAFKLHGDAISDSNSDRDKVVFDHFIGVAARRYLDLFSLKLGMGTPLERKDKETGEVKKFDRKKAKVKVPVVQVAYLEKEKTITSECKSLFPTLSEK